MLAEVKSNFSSGFFITEESIKKIEDLIQSRLGSQEAFYQSYSVRRNDNATITYENSSDLISKEGNGRVGLVTALLVKAGSNLSQLEMNFEHSEKSELSIKSEDRDAALLLSADLKEYLKSEVFIRRLSFLSNIARSRFSPMIIMLAIFSPFFYFVFTVSNRIDRTSRTIDVHKATIDEKLNFIISKYFDNRQADVEAGNIPKYMVATMLLSVLFWLLFNSNVVYPAYTFYWGKEISRYDSSKSIRDKVFWGILVALAVGITGSLLAGKISIH